MGSQYSDTEGAVHKYWIFMIIYEGNTIKTKIRRRNYIKNAEPRAIYLPIWTLV